MYAGPHGFTLLLSFFSGSSIRVENRLGFHGFSRRADSSVGQLVGAYCQQERTKGNVERLFAFLVKQAHHECKRMDFLLPSALSL